MYGNFEICDMPLSLKSNRARVERFLADSGLRLEDVDYYAAVTDDDGNIIAGGGLQGNVIEHAGDIYANLGELETALRFWKLAKQKGDDTCTPLLKKKIKRKKYIK